jgi:lysozyme
MIVRHVTIVCLNFLKGFERFVPVPYDDGYGYMTIGYGHLIKPGEVFTSVTKEQALDILARDVGIAERGVLRNTRVPLEDCQFDALVSFTFNAGCGAYQRSRIRMAVNREDHDEVIRLFPKSFITSGGKYSRGLVRRRKGEAAMYKGE